METGPTWPSRHVRSLAVAFSSPLGAPNQETSRPAASAIGRGSPGARLASRPRPRGSSRDLAKPGGAAAVHCRLARTVERAGKPSAEAVSTQTSLCRAAPKSDRGFLLRLDRQARLQDYCCPAWDCVRGFVQLLARRAAPSSASRSLLSSSASLQGEATKVEGLAHRELAASCRASMYLITDAARRTRVPVT